MRPDTSSYLCLESACCPCEVNSLSIIFFTFLLYSKFSTLSVCPAEVTWVFEVYFSPHQARKPESLHNSGRGRFWNSWKKWAHTGVEMSCLKIPLCVCVWRGVVVVVVNMLINCSTSLWMFTVLRWLAAKCEDTWYYRTIVHLIKEEEKSSSSSVGKKRWSVWIIFRSQVWAFRLGIQFKNESKPSGVGILLSGWQVEKSDPFFPPLRRFEFLYWLSPLNWYSTADCFHV